MDVSRIADEGPALPPGWGPYADAPDGAFAFVGTPDAAATAAWIVSALESLGAPLPTGRYRVSDPGILHQHRHPD